MATAPPRVAAIVVHYGDPAPTRRCLDSLAGFDEVVLVDQPPRLAGEHPNVTSRLEPGTNLGFAAGCNRGVEASSSPFVLLINNDAVLEDGGLEALRAALPTLAEEQAGACLKLLCMDGETLQSAGGLWFTRDGIGFPHGFGELDRGQYDAMPADEIGVPSGAAALYRRSAWEEADGFCEDFFCYCEDGDLGLRLVAMGRSFAWWPAVRVRHELSSSTGAHSVFKAFYVERNHFAVMLHSAPLRLLVLLPLFTLLRIARAAADALRGRGAGSALTRSASPGNLAVTLLRAWLAALRALPRSLTFRRRLQAQVPQAASRAGRFLRSRRVALHDFAATRSPQLRP